MRLAALSLTLFLAFSAAPALAHETHGPCPGSTTAVGSVVHVDVYTRGCLGAAVTVPRLACTLADAHLVSGLHNPILSGSGCETGVILETLELLP
jgi:hypothetical protein